MTSRIIRGGPKGAGELSKVIISCDQMGCNQSVDSSRIERNGGLKEMGWQLMPQGGRLHHYCPKHIR